MDAVMWNKGPIGGPFNLIDQDGKPRSDSDFRGKLLLVYFGYTYCSDICPPDLQAISMAIDRSAAAGEAAQPHLYNVHREHHPPETIKLYLGLFHPRLIGLTGSVRQIK